MASARARASEWDSGAREGLAADRGSSGETKAEAAGEAARRESSPLIGRGRYLLDPSNHYGEFLNCTMHIELPM